MISTVRPLCIPPKTTVRLEHFPGSKAGPLTTPPKLRWSLGLLALFPCSRRRHGSCRAQNMDAVDEAIASLLKQQAVVRKKNQRVPVRSLKVGQRFTGIIRDIGNFGLFVDVGAQRDGLVPISLVSAGYIADIYEEYMPGQKVSVWVAEIKQNGELSLTMQPVRTRKSKGILKQDLSAFDSISPEEWLTGTLMRFTEQGLFVEVPIPDMEGRVMGLVRMKETGRLALDELEVGRKVQVRVLPSGNRSQLNLSMRPMAGLQTSDEFVQLISKDPWSSAQRFYFERCTLHVFLWQGSEALSRGQQAREHLYFCSIPPPKIMPMPFCPLTV
eukprot:symbB.v1.2.022820.t1/scaffold2042.1/size196763/3